MISVLLVDDHISMREGLAAILNSASDIAVVGEASTGREAVELTAQLDPDLVLMDIRMPDLDGIEATRRIVATGSRSRVIILTTFDLDQTLYDAIGAGACGFLLKTTSSRQLLSTLRSAAAGDTVLASELTNRLLHDFVASRAAARPRPVWLDDLSERELEVLGLVAAGLTNDELASRLFIGTSTVKTHVNNVFRKIGARDRVHAVILAQDAQLDQH